IGVFRGGLNGGAVTAIVLGVPGTAGNVPTLQDGRVLALAGYPRTALKAALYGSFGSAFLSGLLLMFFITPASIVALEIGSPELFAVLLFSLIMVAFISGDRLGRGILAAALGLSVAFIGVDPIMGAPRFTFGVS